MSTLRDVVSDSLFLILLRIAQNCSKLLNFHILHEYSSLKLQSWKHKGHLTHEIIAGAAAFEAMRHYEKKKEEQTGQKDKHAFLKEAFVAFAAGEAEKLIETKGLDAIDKAKAKKHAEEQASQLYD
ncbi:1038_t:CDS:2, partial [Dentiscutata heterogama]